MVVPQKTETLLMKNLEDTEALAKRLAQELNPRHVIGLQGEMGSGKTHFVKALATALGMNGREANSPTFAIHQEYQSSQKVLHHIDLFRLENEEEIESSGFWDLFYDDNVVIAVEWIDRIDEKFIPENFTYHRLDWKILPEGGREVKITRR